MNLRHVSLRARSLIGVLPDFLIIGTQKGGTTSLYRNLLDHPWVVPALKKEIHYFDRAYQNGMWWYKNQFQATLAQKIYARMIHGHQLITGEATPSYLYHPNVPKRVFAGLPNVKIIIMLRNPVDRAFSHYQYHVKLDIEPLSFEEAIAKESSRLQGILDRLQEDERYDSDNFYNYSYLSRGIYVDQVQRWLTVFPKEQVLILKSEDFFQNAIDVFRQTLMFLGLPDIGVDHLEAHNVGRSTKLSPETRKLLSEYFAPHNKKLYALVNRDFGWD